MPDTQQVEEPITVGDRHYRAVREGRAQILAPYNDSSKAANTAQSSHQTQKNKPHNNNEGDQAVFYNPIQQYNRDLSVLAILTYGEGAVAQKKERLEKKNQSRLHKPRWKGGKTATTEVESKKRKLEELDVIEESGKNPKKRMKGDKDEDEILEVQELESSDAVDSNNQLADTPATANGQSSNKQEKSINFTILDALSASGLRAVRYAKEIPFATNIVANDLSPEAAKAIELNIDHNDVRGKVHSNVGDARAYMYSKIGNDNHHGSGAYVQRFDVIDLDPYGTAGPFLDAAVQALADGGLLCVTCTDAGVFASNGYPEKAYALYGGVPMKGAHSHEAGLRLILNAVATSAARYGIAIEPLLSLSIDFYARLFIRVHKKPHEVKFLAGTTMITYGCDYGCGAWTTQLIARNQPRTDKGGNEIFKHSCAQAPVISQSCEHCGSKMHLAGPMWAGPLHNPYFVQRILDKLPTLDTNIYGTTTRIKGMLTLALEEDLTLATTNTEVPASDTLQHTKTPESVDAQIIPRMLPHIIDTAPFFFIPSYVSKVLHCATPSEDPLRGAIRKLGYQVTRSHCKPGSFKTNAPWDVIWEVMREWSRQESPVKKDKIKPGMPGWKIINMMRNTNSKHANDLLAEVQKVIEKGIDAKEDLKRLFESGLYRLEHGHKDEPQQNESTFSSIDDQQEGRRGERDVSKLDVVFDAKLGKEKARDKLVRYQINPRAHWGPMNRASGV